MAAMASGGSSAGAGAARAASNNNRAGLRRIAADYTRPSPRVTPPGDGRSAGRVSAFAAIEGKHEYMARIRTRTRADLPPEDQDLLKRDISLYRVLSNNPTAMRAFSGLGQYIRHKTEGSVATSSKKNGIVYIFEELKMMDDEAPNEDF